MRKIALKQEEKCAELILIISSASFGIGFILALTNRFGYDN